VNREGYLVLESSSDDSYSGIDRMPIFGDDIFVALGDALSLVDDHWLSSTRRSAEQLLHNMLRLGVSDSLQIALVRQRRSMLEPRLPADADLQWIGFDVAMNAAPYSSVLRESAQPRTSVPSTIERRLLLLDPSEAGSVLESAMSTHPEIASGLTIWAVWLAPPTPRVGHGDQTSS